MQVIAAKSCAELPTPSYLPPALPTSLPPSLSALCPLPALSRANNNLILQHYWPDPVKSNLIDYRQQARERDGERGSEREGVTVAAAPLGMLCKYLPLPLPRPFSLSLSRLAVQQSAICRQAEITRLKCSIGKLKVDIRIPKREGERAEEAN